MQFVCFFFNICRKFELLISQGSNMPKMRWVVLSVFSSKFHTLSSSVKLLEIG